MKYVYAVILSIFMLFGLWAYTGPSPAGPLDSHSVKISTEQAHGSATHIGGGFFVTAQHVVVGVDTVTVKTNTGREVTADVLWSNKAHDVALLRADIDGIDETGLDCRVPAVGEELKMRGNPLSLENITTWGVVAGLPDNYGQWRYAFPIDGSLGAGMSGGGVFDDDDDLVGVIVGGVMVRYGMGGGPMGVGVIVPSSVVCMLMAR